MCDGTTQPHFLHPAGRPFFHQIEESRELHYMHTMATADFGQEEGLLWWSAFLVGDDDVEIAVAELLAAHIRTALA